MWDLASDKQTIQRELPLQVSEIWCVSDGKKVARCTKIIPGETEQDETKHIINVRQIAKFVVGLGENVAPTDIEEGMRVGFVLFKQKY